MRVPVTGLLVLFQTLPFLILSQVGTELCLNAMDWKSKDDWLDAPRGLWKVDDYPAGWVKELNNLTFAVVYNSGHMVSSSGAQVFFAYTSNFPDHCTRLLSI